MKARNIKVGIRHFVTAFAMLIGSATAQAQAAPSDTEISAYKGLHKAAAAADLDALDRDRYDVVTIVSVANDVTMLKLVPASGVKAGQMTSPYDGTVLIAAAHLGTSR
jgi:hypothetical protein